MEGDKEGPKGAYDIGVGVEPKARHLATFRSCKSPQLLLANKNKAFFVENGNCNYWSRHEN